MTTPGKHRTQSSIIMGSQCCYTYGFNVNLYYAMINRYSPFQLLYLVPVHNIVPKRGAWFWHILKSVEGNRQAIRSILGRDSFVVEKGRAIMEKIRIRAGFFTGESDSRKIISFKG